MISPKSAVVVSLLGLWFWCIWICADYWRYDPHYQFGWIVPLLVCLFAGRRLAPLEGAAIKSFSITKTRKLFYTWVLSLAALAVFPLEIALRESGPARVLLWIICSGTVSLTLGLAGCLGGTTLARALLFPSLFFLTAVPWPTRLEYPLTVGLMSVVTHATIQLLDLLGIAVQSHGSTLMLPAGPVGIVEACSGISSLQVSVMLSLAVGEFFGLPLLRRTLLLVAAVPMALIANCLRTFILCLVLEVYGAAAFDRFHDPISAIPLYATGLLIFWAGTLLRRGTPVRRPSRLESPPLRWESLIWKNVPDLRWFVLIGIGALGACNIGYAVLRQAESPQTQPCFTATLEAGSGNQLAPFPAPSWASLAPDLGQMIQHRAPGLEDQTIWGYHLFWKPSPRAFLGARHRPDGCMPGLGWQETQPVEEMEVALSGRALHWYAFHFKRGPAQALQLWGVWRNGQSLPFDPRLSSSPSQPIAWQPSLRSLGAVEVVSLVVIYSGARPSTAQIGTLLANVFAYKPHQEESSRGRIPL